MAFDAILRGPSSLASVLVMASTAPLSGVNRRTACQLSDSRTNINNVATSRIELLDRFLRGEQQAENITSKCFGLFLVISSIATSRKRRVVDQNVDLAEGLFSLDKEMFDVCLPGTFAEWQWLCRRAWQFDPYSVGSSLLEA